MHNEKKKITLLVVLVAISISWMQAQSLSFEDFYQKQEQKFKNYSDQKQKEFDDFRKSKNEEFAGFMEKNWHKYDSKPEIKPIEEKPLPPIIYEEPKPEPGPTPEPIPQPRPIEIDNEILEVPTPTPQPEPIVPIIPIEDQTTRVVKVPFYGSILSIRFPNPDNFQLGELTEKNFSKAWLFLSDEKYNVVISDALDVRSNLNLCDWAYIEFLQATCEQAYGKGSNEASFMQGYILVQSGYKIRLAYAGNRFYVLVASQYIICDRSYYELDGENFYPLNCNAHNLYICDASFEAEKSLQLQIATEQKFIYAPSQTRTLKSAKGVSVSVCVNTNSIDFYNNYPSAMINEDFGTVWAAYANTPLETSIRQSLYPQLKQSIEGLTPREATNKILNWVQTAFVYGYDDEIWGDDRAFFATETLYYPYSDCEDRSILFSRLVRDILNLDVVLLYYPGHLATAVCIPGELRGDYIAYHGKQYTVCDPTYIGAPVGKTMSGMDNASAKVIVLKK